jgi:hypothetical protein
MVVSVQIVLGVRSEPVMCEALFYRVCAAILS